MDLRLLRSRTGWCGIPINPLTTKARSHMIASQ
jgi:hypothetical protein